MSGIKIWCKKDEILTRYAFGWQPFDDGIEALEEKYEVLNIDSKDALITEADASEAHAKVLLVDKMGLEKWKD